MGYEATREQVGVGLTGRAWLTEPDLTWRERTLHHLTLALLGVWGPWQPGLLVHIPLDDERRAVVRLVVGLSLTRSL